MSFELPETEPLLPRNSQRRARLDLTWFLSYALWNVPIFLYRFFALQLVHVTISKLNKLLPERFRNENLFDSVGTVIMRILQITIFAIFFLQVLFQLILFIVDENLILCNSCSFPFKDDTIEEIIFASDIILSLISLASCYFIFINLDIFDKFLFKGSFIPNQSEFSVCRNLNFSLPNGKGKFLSKLGILSAYIIILTVPIALASCLFTHEEVSSLNTYLEIVPDLLNSCTNYTVSGKSLGVTYNISSCVYKYLTYAINQYWHICPVLSCIAVTYVCVELQHKVDNAVVRSRMYINREGNAHTGNGRPIVAFYELINGEVKEYSRKVYYIATLNIISVVILLASLFSSYIDSSNNGYTQKMNAIADLDEDIHKTIAYRSPLIYLYHFISVWLMSDAIITLNTKLAKFSDSILKEDGIAKFLTDSSRKFKRDMRDQLNLISNSRERFEVAFLGDFSLSVFYTIIPFGVGAMINFSVRAVDALTSQMCDTTN